MASVLTLLLPVDEVLEEVDGGAFRWRQVSSHVYG
jgi:hypothetical protein